MTVVLRAGSTPEWLANCGVRRSVALAGTALAGLLASNPVFAQAVPTPAPTTAQPIVDQGASTAASDERDIVVTGTQIRGVAPVGSTIIAVDRAQIDRTGLATTNDILRSVPQVAFLGPGEATSGPTVNNSNLNVTRANSINLRGLGPQATLTLLNGRRVPPAGTGAQLFDPSAIPTLALGRIDIVADGASATYGSDAVAGVANLILRRDLNGLEVSGRYGDADGYYNDQLGAIFGHRWDSGSVMIAGEYTHNSELMQSERAGYFDCDQTRFGYANNCAGNPPAPGNLVFGTTVFGLPAGSGVRVTQSQLLATRNIFPSSLFNASIPQSKRYSAVATVRQEFGAVTLWAEGYFSRRESSYVLGTPTINTAVPSSNPNFVFVTGQSQTSETVQYSLINDYGPAIADTISQSWQAAAGADIQLGGDWTLSTYYEHNSNRENLDRAGQINANLLRTALACTTSVCFNPFGTGGSASNMAAASTFIGYVRQNSYFESNLVNAKVDGTIFHIPGGDVKLAVGGEYHRDSLFNFSPTNTRGQTLDSVFLTANTTSARKITSGFAEAVIPIVGADNEMSGIHRLTLNIAGRYDHYSDFGSTTNPKFGITWAPTSDFNLRGSYGTSFRAPTVSDINPLSTASVLLSTTVAGPGRNVATVVGGNPNLVPETATTWSAGIDLHPAAVPGLTGSLNFYHIKYNNIIDTPGNTPAAFANTTLYAPFLQLNPNQAQIDAVKALPFFAPITAFGSAGFVPGNVFAIVDGRRNNVGSLKTNGIDFMLNYRFESGVGDWTLGATGTYVFKYDYQLVPGAPVLDRINQATFPLRFRTRGQIGWHSGPFDATAFVNYTNAYRVVRLITPTQNDRVKPYTTIDLTVSYSAPPESGLLKDLRISLSAINLFDRDPPLALVSNAQEYDSGAANILGRQLSISVRKKF